MPTNIEQLARVLTAPFYIEKPPGEPIIRLLTETLRAVPYMLGDMTKQKSALFNVATKLAEQVVEGCGSQRSFRTHCDRWKSTK